MVTIGITKNQRITIKICELYYKDNLSQKEISAKLGISRPQISRIISNARDNNIITIKINNPYPDETALEKELIEKFNLKDALVFNTDGFSSEDALMELARQAAAHLGVYIPNQGSIGLMSGKTISALVKSIKNFKKYKLEIVPLVGGLGSDGTDWHANIISKKFADKSSGKYYLLNAPVLVKQIESKEFLVEEPEIGKVLKKGTECDIAIVGIGQVSEMSTSVVAGSLTLNELKMLTEMGAVASVCGSYLDINGNIIENDITKRTIGQTLESISKSKIIAIAKGRNKVEAIRAVLLGEHIDILITNLETAKSILN